MANVIFVGSSEGLTVLEKSNGGFKVARRVLEGTHVTACAADPDGAAYMGTVKGLWKTTDNGATLEGLSPGIENKEVTYIFVDKKTHRVHVGGHPVELYLSDDHGGKWRKVGFADRIPEEIRKMWMFHPIPSYGPHVKSIATGPGGRTYLNIEEGWGYRSDDDCRTWTFLRRGLHIDAHVLASHPTDRDKVFSTTAFGLVRSTDGGLNWIDADVSDYGVKDYGGGVAIHPQDPNIVLFSTGIQRIFTQAVKGSESKIFRSMDGGESWHQVKKGLPDNVAGRVEVLHFDHENPAKLYATTDMGDVYEGVDAGESWRQIASGLGSIYMYASAVI